MMLGRTIHIRSICQLQHKSSLQFHVKKVPQAGASERVIGEKPSEFVRASASSLAVSCDSDNTEILLSIVVPKK